MDSVGGGERAHGSGNDDVNGIMIVLICLVVGIPLAVLAVHVVRWVRSCRRDNGVSTGFLDDAPEKPMDAQVLAAAGMGDAPPKDLHGENGNGAAESFEPQMFIATNALLDAPLAVGVRYCKSMSEADVCSRDFAKCKKDPMLCLKFGGAVKGVRVGENWIRVGERYLPTQIEGIPVIRSEHEEANGHRGQVSGFAPGLLFYDEAYQSAVKIQSCFRGFRARKALSQPGPQQCSLSGKHASDLIQAVEPRPADDFEEAALMTGMPPDAQGYVPKSSNDFVETHVEPEIPDVRPVHLGPFGMLACCACNTVVPATQSRINGQELRLVKSLHR